MGDRKVNLSKAQKERVMTLLELPLPEGECRSVYMCQDGDCRQIQAHDFIPYGLGRGRTLDPCLCRLPDANWIFRAVKVAERTNREGASVWLKWMT